MKKAILCAALAAVCLLAGCGGAMADGLYRAEMDDAYVAEAGYGWRDTLTVEYAGGVITDAVFESFDAEGNPKSADGAYPMTPPPAEWIPQLSGNVKRAAAPDDVQAVAGATLSSKNAAAMFRAILERGKPGGEAVQVPAP